MGIPGYDSWATSGYTYRCICGALWTDSDGGPCHGECKNCKEVVESEELSAGLCSDCDSLKCKSCGELMEPEYITDKLCNACREELHEVKKASNEHLPSFKG